MIGIKRGLNGLGALLLTLLGVVTQAQPFPVRPIHLIVPFSPGGGTDILARQLAQALGGSEQWQVVVENRPGGNGAVALGAIARAPADGYTLILALRENLIITPLLKRQKGETSAFDPLKDFVAIAHVADAPMVVVTGADSEHKNMVAALAATQQQGALRFGTSGQGSMSHLLWAMLRQASGSAMTHVPYKGSNPALTDLVGGHLDLVGGSIASAKSFIESGRVRPLAVSSSGRVAALPDVPTIAELGYAGFEVVTWYGLFGPADLPDEVVQTLNQATNKILATPALQSTLMNQGMVARMGVADDFDRRFRHDWTVLAQSIKGLGMSAP